MQQQLLANCRRNEMESEWVGKGEQEQKAEKVVQKGDNPVENGAGQGASQRSNGKKTWSLVKPFAGYDQMERINQRADYCDYFYYNCVRKCLGSHWGTRPRESVSRCCQLLMTTTPLTTLLPLRTL
ncbi:uncharacterized protein LOC117582377 [Drosophila guanche]|uniref:uncharacterized protein LOC117582377 n=1 Tax=Drosophila guanche TaxID=7266 RepID=UPI001471CFC4|nr:uncharacterized protein LOC117582377 [Drosophila guanche]